MFERRGCETHFAMVASCSGDVSDFSGHNGLWVKGINESSLSVGWTPILGATEYHVSWRPVKDASNSNSSSSSSSASSFSFQDVHVDGGSSDEILLRGLSSGVLFEVFVYPAIGDIETDCG